MKDLTFFIQKYLEIGISLGFFDSENIENVKEQLSKIKEIVYIEQFEGEAAAKFDIGDNGDAKIFICDQVVKKEAKDLNRDYEEYLFEQVFHEITHCFIIRELDDVKTLPVKNSYNEDRFCFVNHGSVLLSEYICQSVAQSMVCDLYKKEYPIRNERFIYDEQGASEKKYIYDYSTSLQWYGELEKIAKSFIDSIYGSDNTNLVFKDYFAGTFGSEVIKVYSKIDDGIDKLYLLLASMGYILICDYYQLRYINKGDLDPKIYFNIDILESFVNIFNSIIKKVIRNKSEKK